MKKASLFLLGAFLVLSAPFWVSAQETFSVEDAPVKQEAQTITVATVNIYDAKVDFQENNNIGVTFNLANRKQAQPDVRYSIQLIKKENEKQSIVDEYVYPEVLSLGEDQIIKKEVEYLAPQYLTGEFEVWLIAKNQNGLTFAMVNPGKVVLSGNDQYLEIDSDSCYLTVNEENKQYILEEGVDVKSDEKLIAHCDVINHNNAAVSFVPKFKTYWRTTFGQEVSTNQEEQNSQTLNAGERRQFSFIIPKAQVPQAYDTVLELNQDSNKVAFHYVLRGLSATVQNLRLDKDYYQKGETARVSFYWTASADNFPGSRLGKTDNGKMFADIKVSSSKNQGCFSLLQKELNQNSGVVEYESMVGVDCQNPLVSVDIKDNDGNILDKKDFSIESKSANFQSNESQVDKKLSAKLVVGIIILALFLISLGIIIFKKKIGLPVYIFSILAGGCLFVGINEVRADSFVIVDPAYGGSDAVVFTVSLDKASYNPGEIMSITGAGRTDSCGNLEGNLSLAVDIQGSLKTFFNTFVSLNESTGNKVVTFNAPLVPGSYVARFSAGYISVYSPTILRTANYDIPYTVTGSLPNNPPTIPTLTGPVTGLVNTPYGFTTTSTDPENDTIRYGLDWENDNNVNQWTPFVASGTPRTSNRQWIAVGAKTLKARACDSNNNCSGWSAPHTIVISAPPPAPIVTLSASPNPLTNLNNGVQTVGTKQTTLTWTINNSATACTTGCICDLTGPSGTLNNQTYPTPNTYVATLGAGSHDFSVICTNSIGSGNANTTVMASCNPPAPWTDPGCNVSCGSGTTNTYTMQNDCSILPVPSPCDTDITCPDGTSFREVGN